MTVVINKREELEALIDDSNNIIIYDDLVINCDIDIDVFDIEAKNIKARDIGVYNNIKATNIEACNIYANNIEACNIDAINIYANNIEAEKIDYYAFCIARKSLICETIEGRRQNSLHACLDQPIEYI